MDYIWVYKAIQYIILVFFVWSVSDFRNKGESVLLVRKSLVVFIRFLYPIPIIVYVIAVLYMETFKFQDLFALILTFNGTFLIIRAKCDLEKEKQHRWSGYCCPITKIITHGIYAYIRHPMYTGVYIFSIGSSFTIFFHSIPDYLLYLYFVPLIVVLGYLVFISNRETNHFIKTNHLIETVDVGLYITHVHPFLPLRVFNKDRNPFESAHSIILFISQLAGAAVIITGVFLLQNKGLTMHHLIATFVIALFGVVFSILSNQGFFNAVGIDRPFLDVSVSIWITFILDLGILAYLIYSSGGLSSSPFVSYLILVPTVGLFLGLAPTNISINYLCATIIAVVLVFLFSDAELERSVNYHITVAITFISTMAVALVGNFIRRASWSRRQEVKTNAT